jgi:hypothetical protein
VQTLKTSFVILVLAAMFYGVYVVVNTPPPSGPQVGCRCVWRRHADIDRRRGSVSGESGEPGDTSDR